MDYAHAALTALEIACAVVTAASAVCAATPTPAAGSLLGKVYRGVEIAALLVGRAKQSGVIPANPAVDAVVADAEKVAKDVLPALAPAAPEPPKG